MHRSANRNSCRPVRRQWRRIASSVACRQDFRICRHIMSIRTSRPELAHAGPLFRGLTRGGRRTSTATSPATSRQRTTRHLVAGGEVPLVPDSSNTARYQKERTTIRARATRRSFREPNEHEHLRAPQTAQFGTASPMRESNRRTGTAAKGTPWPSTPTIACHPTGRRSARLPGVICPHRGHPRGRFRTNKGQTPRLFVLMRVPLTRDRSRNPLAPLFFSRMLANPLSAFWAQSGAGSDPLPIYGSTAPKPAASFAGLFVVRGRSQPAPAARYIPAGRLRTRLRGGWRARSIPWVSEKRGSRRAFRG